jgi:cobyric acid synthase
MEGSGGAAAGLGLLAVEAIFAPAKHTARVQAQPRLAWAADLVVRSYEIRMGWTQRDRTAAALTILDDHGQIVAEDSCVGPDGRVWGC